MGWISRAESGWKGDGECEAEECMDVVESSRSRVSALVAGSGSGRSVSVGQQACGAETKVKCLMGSLDALPDGCIKK